MYLCPYEEDLTLPILGLGVSCGLLAGRASNHSSGAEGLKAGLIRGSEKEIRSAAGCSKGRRPLGACRGRDGEGGWGVRSHTLSKDTHPSSEPTRVADCPKVYVSYGGQVQCRARCRCMYTPLSTANEDGVKGFGGEQHVVIQNRKR